MARRKADDVAGTLKRALDTLERVPVASAAPDAYVAPWLRSGAPSAATPAQRWAALVRSVGCLICRRFAPLYGRVELHHVAEGSGLRSDFSVAPLCELHHRGSQGLHGLSPAAFVVAYRVPGESEFGLLIWVAEDIARLRLR